MVKMTDKLTEEDVYEFARALRRLETGYQDDDEHQWYLARQILIKVGHEFYGGYADNLISCINERS